MAQFSGGAIAIVKRHGGRGDGLPATIVERQLMASLPGGGAGCLASGMTQLDPQTDRRPGPNIFDYAAQGVFGFIIPQPQIPGEIRPAGSTAVASRINRPAPEKASWPRWIRCQEVALPSSAEY